MCLNNMLQKLSFIENSVKAVFKRMNQLPTKCETECRDKHIRCARHAQIANVLVRMSGEMNKSTLTCPPHVLEGVVVYRSPPSSHFLPNIFVCRLDTIGHIKVC